MQSWFQFERSWLQVEGSERSSWVQVGPSWAKLGQVGPKLDQVGPSWGHVGPRLVLCWPKLGLCCGFGSYVGLQNALKIELQFWMDLSSIFYRFLLDFDTLKHWFLTNPLREIHVFETLLYTKCSSLVIDFRYQVGLQSLIVRLCWSYVEAK